LAPKKPQLTVGEEMQEAPQAVREDGVRLAIDAAGGVAALARGLGISQPSVSAWRRVPADRVVAVEALTGVKRQQLRPDLFANIVTPETPRVEREIDALDEARAQEYLLLAALLTRPPTQALLDQIAGIKGDASPLGMAHLALADAARAVGETKAGEEYFKLFIGVGRGEILPYGSYYLTGFLHERPLARLREDLARLGIERKEGVFEPEDHLGSLFEVMAGLIKNSFGTEASEADRFFAKHIQPWAGRMLIDIGASATATFYKPFAALGLTWLDIEAEAQRLPQ
jgi:TorA maturation chaperone TorD